MSSLMYVKFFMALLHCKFFYHLKLLTVLICFCRVISPSLSTVLRILLFVFYIGKRRG